MSINVMLEAQHTCFQWLGSHKLGQRWMIASIEKAWDVARDEQEHHNVILHDEREEEDLQGLTFVNEEIK